MFQMNRRTFVKGAVASVALSAGCFAGIAVAEQDAEMLAGTYRSEVYGFYPGMPLTVEVKVSGHAIESIEIVGDNMETPLMLRATEDLLIPRIIEGQTTSVDVIAGATMTSAAVRLAVTDCIEQAYAAAGLQMPMGAFSADVEDASSAEPIALDADVLVVGLGGAGIAAALSAAEAGARVLAIDKAGKYGGTICVTGEAMAVNPPRLCEELNDGAAYADGDEILNDWDARTQGDAKREMIKLLLDESGETIDWLMYDHDWPFGAPNPGHAEWATFLVDYHYLPDNNYGNKAQIAGYIDKLMADYEALGGIYMLETEATELLYDGEANAVVGVKAVGRNGQPYVINAKAVLFGTGGYGCNKELMDRFMVNDYFNLSGDWHAYGMTTNDGKMIQSALEIGAGTYNPSMPPICHLAGFPVNLTGFGTHEKEGETSFFTGRTPIWSQGDLPTALSVAADSLAVSMRGERFFNEQNFIYAGSVKAGPTYYTIWSQEQFDTFKSQGLDYEDLGPSMGYLCCQSTIPAGVPLDQLDEVVEAAMETGYMFKAETIEELAGLIDVDARVLCDTVDTYNSHCVAGDDPDFGKDPAYLDAIGYGPYYAITGCNFFYTSGGALDVDEHFMVLQRDGETPIGGLYALGTDCMGVIMSNREQYLDYGGADAAWAFTSGRLAGRHAAQQVKA